MVTLQALNQCLGCVVRPLHQSFSGLVIAHVFRRRRARAIVPTSVKEDQKGEDNDDDDVVNIPRPPSMLHRSGIRSVVYAGLAVAYDLGGANLTWYERPLFLWIQRPQMRSSRIESGTSSESTELTHSPFSASTSSRAFACTRVRGKPSRMKPVAQSGSCGRGSGRGTRYQKSGGRHLVPAQAGEDLRSGQCTPECGP